MEDEPVYLTTLEPVPFDNNYYYDQQMMSHYYYNAQSLQDFHTLQQVQIEPPPIQIVEVETTPSQARKSVIHYVSGQQIDNSSTPEMEYIQNTNAMETGPFSYMETRRSDGFYPCMMESEPIYNDGTMSENELLYPEMTGTLEVSTETNERYITDTIEMTGRFSPRLNNEVETDEEIYPAYAHPGGGTVPMLTGGMENSSMVANSESVNAAPSMEIEAQKDIEGESEEMMTDEENEDLIVYKSSKSIPEEERVNLKKTKYCSICKKECEGKVKLIRHIEKQHIADDGQYDPNQKFDCPICSKQCKYRHSLATHIACHSNDRRRSRMKGTYMCSICRKKFMKDYFLRSHVSKHVKIFPENLGAKPYACANCNVSFKEIPDLRIHMETLHHSKNAQLSENDSSEEDNDPLFLCVKCNRSCLTQRGLSIHLAKHRKDDIAKIPYENGVQQTNKKLDQTIGNTKLDQTGSKKLDQKSEKAKLDQTIDNKKFDQIIGYKKLDQMIENKKFDQIIKNTKLDQKLENKKLDQTVKNTRLDQTIENKKFDQIIGNKKLEQSIKITKLDQTIENKKFDQIIGNKKLEQSIKITKLDQTIENKKFDQIIGNKKLEQSIKITKLDQTIENKKFDQIIGYKKSDQSIKNTKLHQTIVNKNFDQIIGNKELDQTIKNNKLDQTFENKKFDQAIENNKFDQKAENKKIDQTIPKVVIVISKCNEQCVKQHEENNSTNEQQQPQTEISYKLKIPVNDAKNKENAETNNEKKDLWKCLICGKNCHVQFLLRKHMMQHDASNY